MIPFTVDQVLSVFERYNVALWPAQLFLYAFGVLAICLAIQRKVDFSRGISLVLSMFWIWMGLLYHFWFFSTINRAALMFSAFFVLQGLLFFIAGVYKNNLTFQFRPDLFGVTGGIFLLYALVIYPALSYRLGHRYPAAPTFGLPCPTTIFTLGMLLWTNRRVPLYMLPIPFAWSLLGISAAMTLGMTEDYGLLVAGLVGSSLIILRDTQAVMMASPSGVRKG